MKVNIRGTIEDISLADKNLSDVSKTNTESKWETQSREINNMIRENY